MNSTKTVEMVSQQVCEIETNIVTLEPKRCKLQPF